MGAGRGAEAKSAGRTHLVRVRVAAVANGKTALVTMRVRVVAAVVVAAVAPSKTSAHRSHVCGDEAVYRE